MTIFHGFINALFPLAFAAACALSVAAYVARPSWEARDRWLAALIAPAVVVLGGAFIRLSLQAPFDFWESLRLLPAYLLARGVPLYYPPHAGPVLDMMYGPMTAIAYWPITLFTSRPDFAAMGAKLLTVSYYFLPALWLILNRREKDQRHRVLGLCLFLGFAFYSLESEVLRGSAFGNHSDAPALGLSALACIFLLKRPEKSGWQNYLLSAICAVLAIWTKQVTVPLLIALPAYVWRSHGRRPAFVYILCLTAASGVSLVAFGWMFNARNMLFNLVIHPSNEPWENHLLKVQGRAIVELLAESRWMLMVLIFFIAYETRSSAPKRAKGHAWFAGGEYKLFLWVGVCMIPVSIVGRLKIAGALNALSYSVYFFALAVGVLFMEVACKSEPYPHDRVAKGLVKVGTLFLLASAVSMQTPTLLYYYLHFSQTLDLVRANPLKKSFLYAKANPGQLYLPRNPLVTFLAEGKLYHFDFAVGERAIAGFSITEDHFRAFLPAGIRWVAYGPGELDEYILRFLPEFNKRVEVPLLPDWKVYTRP